jgi:hypothetical protein
MDKFSILKGTAKVYYFLKMDPIIEDNLIWVS